MDFINSLIGGGVVAAALLFVRFLIERHDNNDEKQKEIIDAIHSVGDKVDNVDGELQEHKAVLARRHILRFNDELYNHIDHSKEYFDQTLEDIDTYENYCATHPNFKNQRTVFAEDNIKSVYKKLTEEHKFL